MIAFIQAYMVDGIDYYIVYSDDVVETYNNKGGQLRMTGRYANLSGLPIVYKTTNEINETLVSLLSISYSLPAWVDSNH